MPAVLTRTSKVLVLVVSETYMDVYSQLNIGLYLGLCTYEGIQVKRSCPGRCIWTENMCEVLPVFDYFMGLVYSMFCPEPSRF